MRAPAGRRVLIVDDDRAMVRTLGDVLQLAGWETSSAFSGEDALTSLTRSTYAVVLMDVRMAGMSGVTALRAMREQWPALPVLLMTAYASPAVLKDAADAGADRVLHKPIPIPDLLNALAAVAGSRGTLLLVDDDREFRQALTTILVGRGYAVRQAASLPDALASVRASPPAVVVLDLKLADVEPSEVLDAVRHAHNGTAIILCTGHRALLESMLTGGLPDRVLGYVIKPFAPEQLTALIESVVG
jgi:two-component system, response regulator PdtaR